MLRRWLARRLTPLVWRWDPRRRAEAMREYGLIEKDSGCQILDALALVREPEPRARLFQQVLEEFHHSDLFEDACRELSDTLVGTPVVTRDALIGKTPGPDALLDLMAYVHVGEAAVEADFSAYAKAPLDPEIARAFARAGADERHHVGDSRRLLEETAGGDKARADRAVFKARVLRGWRAYVKAASAVGQLPLSLLLGLLYALAGPLRNLCAKRLAAPRAEQLASLREQWRRASPPR